LAALLRRHRDGRGCQVEVSMVESMTRFVAPRLAAYLGSGDEPRRSGGADSVIAIYQVFHTADLPITLALGNDAIWQRFWVAVDEVQFGLKASYATNALRRTHRAEIVGHIAAILKRRRRADWLALFESIKVPAGPINRIADVASDPNLTESGFLYSVERSGIKIPQIGLGIKFDGRSESCAAAPPRLGADSDAVLEEWLGSTDEDRARLRLAQVI